MDDKLPRGIWFEEKRNRWRVRMWRNHRVYLSYHDTRDEAISAYNALLDVLSRIAPRRRRKNTAALPAAHTGFGDLAASVKRMG